MSLEFLWCGPNVTIRICKINNQTLYEYAAYYVIQVNKERALYLHILCFGRLLCVL